MICPHCGKTISEIQKQVYSEDKKKYIPFNFTVARLSDSGKAIAVEWFDDKVWMPLSQLKHMNGDPVGPDDFKEGENIQVKVAEWIVKEKGLKVEDGKPEEDIPF